MFNQRGFVNPLIILVILGIVSAVAIQKNVLPLQVPQKHPDKLSAPIESVSSTPSPTPNPNKITASGIFNFSDYKVKYTFIVPKDGGEVTGSIEGVCTGGPTGKYAGGEGGKIEGEFQGKCSAGPLNLINVDIKGNYTGTVYLNEKRINMIWELISPSNQRGSFNMPITQ